MRWRYSVTVLRGYRYRFLPTAEQADLLRRTLGCVRFVYNKALSERTAMWAGAKKSLTYEAQSRALTGWKKSSDMAFLNHVSCVPLQQGLRHLQHGFSCFFSKTCGYPKPKRKKADAGSAVFVGHGFRYKTGQIILAKMSTPLDIRWSRPLPVNAVPSSVTVTLDPAGRWHVSILCEDKTTKPLPRLMTAVALDLGITHLVTLSTGEKISNPRFHAHELARLSVLHRRLSKKQKGSKNREKARFALARLHARVGDRRRDHLHKLSTRLVRENQVIVVEDLNVRGMVQNRCLSRVISDTGWSELTHQLEYKSEWYGRTFIKVDRFFPSSKTCSGCGHVVERLPLDVRRWTCPACSREHDRDHNAARNILAAGLAVKACGPGVSQRALRNAVQSGLKQEGPVVRPAVPRSTSLTESRS